MKAKKKILFFIDDQDFKVFLGDFFKKSGHALMFASSDPVQNVFDELPHLIVIDEEYQSGEGKSIALILKDDLVLQYIPIILLVRQPQILTQKEAGHVDFYVDKTKDLSLFSNCVRNALSRNYHELDLNPLTHLPGVRSTILRLEKAIATRKPFTVCSIDLSDLSVFNSAYGDARGDQIIVKLAKIIQDVLKKEGIKDAFVGHLGGDDFIIVMKPSIATKISEGIIEKFDAAILNFYDPKDRKTGFIFEQTDEGVIKQYPLMSISIAIIPSDVSRIKEISDVGRIAAELKKQMKSVPGSRYFHYQRDAIEIQDAGSTGSKQHRPGVLTQRYGAIFRNILKGKKVRTVYQPIVDLKQKATVGYEALTRLVEDGPLSNIPLLFEVARDCGKIKEFDEICVESALRSAQKIQPGRKLFINLNQETLIDSKIMNRLFRDRGNVRLGDLVIEVTEQSILREFDKLSHALSELRHHGASVAIDDLGGGAVSLRDVAILKPDFIKFDRSLVRQIDKSVTKQQIILSMILFANGIHAATTAEGIETQRECETVMMCGIGLAQGYFFAKPGEAFPDINPF